MKTTPHKTIFISDLHLAENRPDVAERFLRLLENCTEQVDALYILGDLFVAWIGDDDLSDFHLHIISALKNATSRGLPIYFLRGNRDFLIGKRFLKASGCQLLADEEKINLYGTPVLLMHGDTLCTLDVHYQKWRKYARNPVLHTLLFLSLPLSLRRRIADKMRAKSAEHMEQPYSPIMDVVQGEVERVMQKHLVQYLIHGHTHRPAIQDFFIHKQPVKRIVLGSWDHAPQDAKILIWDETGKISLDGVIPG